MEKQHIKGIDRDEIIMMQLLDSILFGITLCNK